MIIMPPIVCHFEKFQNLSYLIHRYDATGKVGGGHHKPTKGRSLQRDSHKRGENHIGDVWFLALHRPSHGSSSQGPAIIRYV